MIDTDAELIAYLVGRPELAGCEFYAATELPPGKKVSDLPIILLQARGGPGLDFSARQMSVSYQALVYGASDAEALATAGRLFDALNHRQGRVMRFARLEGVPTLLKAPGARWPYALMYFTVHFAK
jgi:hypothetical protein